jgi:hypothetical protein
MNENSPAGKLNKTDVVALFKNSGLVALAAGLTYLGENMGGLDLGSAALVVVPIISILLDSAIKWAKDNTPK